MDKEEIDFSKEINTLKAEKEASQKMNKEASEDFGKKVDKSTVQYGIEIESFYDNDPKPVLDELKQILVNWQEKSYPDDETRWKEYYEDILTLVHKRTYNSKFDG